jgi:hypothetical protein
MIARNWQHRPHHCAHKAPSLAYKRATPIAKLCRGHAPMPHRIFAPTIAALLIAGAALPAGPAPAANAGPTAPTAAMVDALAAELTAGFVFPEVGARYAAALKQKLASGAYAAISDPEALAKALTSDLQAVAPDGHLKVFSPAATAKAGPRGAAGAEAQGLIAGGWLADGVAYANFNLFPGDPETVAKVDAFIAAHAGAKVLIIDVRGHRGGGLAEMDRLFPQMFTRETALVTMDTRQAVEEQGAGPLRENATLRRQESPAGVVRRTHYAMPAARPVWANTKIYLLTARRTASAAEHLALSLKRTGRATLVGEATRGANHFGGLAELPGGFGVFVPVGRTFDPDTGKDWEGSGVAPDVAVPAAEALDKALALAGVDPAKVHSLPGAR